MSLYLSHLRLSRDPAAQAFAELLLPARPGDRIAAQHHLMWSVFGDTADRERDFLWREESNGSFLVLSARMPQTTALFEAPRVKNYAPEFSAGDQMDFVLRANATRMKRDDKRTRVDVVMDVLHKVEQKDRAANRMRIATQEGASWLTRQGEKSGFRVIEAKAEDYSTVYLPRVKEHTPASKKNDGCLGILDLSGRIEVLDPQLFLKSIMQGFGRAKAFGCGLMLLRRAH